jgi:hypothetical protein
MKDTAELLRGIAALLWPAAVIVAIFVFRAQLGGLIGRIRRARFPGGEIELALDQLQATTQGLEETLERTPAPVPATNTEATLQLQLADDEPIRSILESAANNPRAGLMLVSAELETAMRRVLAAVGHYPERSIGIRQMARELRRVAGLPMEYERAFDEFAEVRNAIVHGLPNISDDEVLRAVDVGLSLLRLIYVWPYERNRVVAADLEVYADPNGAEPREDLKAVLLETEGSDGSVAERVFPTTKAHFRPGKWCLGNGACLAHGVHRGTGTHQAKSRKDGTHRLSSSVACWTNSDACEWRDDGTRLGANCDCRCGASFRDRQFLVDECTRRSPHRCCAEVVCDNDAE